MERWLSGRKRQIANLLYLFTDTEGSNPSFSYWQFFRIQIQYYVITRGIVVQLVRAPPCHGGRCGFESRQSRSIFNKKNLLFHLKSCYNKITVNINLNIDKHYDRAILIWNRFRYDPNLFSGTICCSISTIPSR